MTTYIAGVKIDIDSTYSSVLNRIQDLLTQEGCHYITTTNPEFVMAAQTDSEFKALINASDLSTPDGSGILLAHHYLNRVQNYSRNMLFPLKALIAGLYIGVFGSRSRVTGLDLVEKICALAEQKHYSLFFLGGRQKDSFGRLQANSVDMSQLVISRLLEKYPTLNIIGATSQFSCEAVDDDKTQQYIHKCMTEKNVKAIDIVFVAYGHVKQEKWIARNSCKINAKVSLGVGGTFEIIANIKKRAPHIFTSVGLEWLFRLIQEPTRIKRIFNAVVLFPLFIYTIALKDK